MAPIRKVLPAWRRLSAGFLLRGKGAMIIGVLTLLAIVGMASGFGSGRANAIQIGIGAFSGSATVIDFDDLTGGSTIDTGDIVTNQYAGLGVTFNDPDYPARANSNLQPEFSGSSAPNILFVQQHDGNPLGNPLQIQFAVPQLRVGMLWRASLGPQITMNAFGNDGLLETLTLTSGTSCGDGECGFIGLERSEGITRVELSDPRGATNYNFELDDVRFEALEGCGATPLSGCRSAGKSLLLLKNSSDDTKDKLTWKWLKGAATMPTDLGVPTGATNYALCVYAGTAMAKIDLPAGSKWQAAGTSGFKFKDPTGTPDGAQKASLKSGAAGKAKALVKGKGANLPDDLVPALPLPVTVQLVNDANSTCFESVYNMSNVIKNDAKQFKAKTP